jgi:transposase
MSRLERRLQVQELLFSGYSHEKISQKLRISTKTVSRDIQWVRDNSQNWLEDLAENGFGQEYREAIEGYKQDIMRLQEMQDNCTDDNLKLKIIRTITDTRRKYIEQFAQFPVVWALDVFVKNNNPQPIEKPILPSLSGISGIKKRK